MINNNFKHTNRSWYTKLWFIVLVFMLAGVIFGIVNPSLAIKTKPAIDLFIRTIKLLVGPIVFFTVLIGIIGMGSLKQLGTIGVKAFIYFEVMSTIALIIGLVFGHIFHPGNGLNLSISGIDPHLISKYTNNQADVTSLSKIMLSAIPHNLWDPFIKGDTLQVLFIALVLGFILFYSVRARRESLMNGLHKIQSWLFKILSIVMWFSPIASFAAMAFMLGQFGSSVVIHMLELVATMVAACLFFIIVMLGIVAKIAGFNILQFLNFIKDEIILVFATSSSESVLGPIMQKLKNAGCGEAVVGIVVPAGYSFNLDGTNIYLALVIAFLSQAFNIHLSWQEHLMIIFVLMITSKGAAGVSGSGFVVLAGTLATMHSQIPVITIAVLLGIDKIMSELRSTTNLVGNSVAAVIISRMERQLDHSKFQQCLSAK